MKYFYLSSFLLIFSCVNAQENFQTVTERGNATNREVQFTSLNANKYAFIGGNAPYARIGAFDAAIGFDKLIIEAAKLGLGVINPTEKLEVDGFIKSGILSFGFNPVDRMGPRNFLTLGGDDHASLLIGSNLFIEQNATLKVAMDHHSLRGAGILIPGNGMPHQNAIQFHTNPVGTAVAGSDGANLRMIVTAGGEVGIGTATPTEKLAVNGKIRAKEIKVEAENWPDYVFEETYEPKPLLEIEKFIKANKHLPDVPSAKDVAQNGIELGEMNKLLLRKIEELTLHLIEKDKREKKQDQTIKLLSEQLNKNEKRMERLEKLIPSH